MYRDESGRLVNVPSVEMLKQVDALVFDIQDVGARFYTYLYTMSLAMEAARLDNPPAFVQNTLSNLMWTPGIIRHYRGSGGVVFKVAFTSDGIEALREIISDQRDRRA